MPFNDRKRELLAVFCRTPQSRFFPLASFSKQLLNVCLCTFYFAFLRIIIENTSFTAREDLRWEEEVFSSVYGFHFCVQSLGKL